MQDWQLQTPIALIIFNRPHTTKVVMDAIRQMRPPKFFIIADGPRPDKPGEAEKCEQARAIAQQVDWDCEVFMNFSDKNLGCGYRPSSGISWVFEQVEEAIIIEDDCLPDPSFFRYCEENLERYRHDERIMAICGLNVQFGNNPVPYSYYFSLYGHCWGWASWRRAWQYFDYDLKLWPEIRDRGKLIDIFGNPYAVKVWTHALDLTYNKGLDCWDFQWMFAMWIQGAYAILPHHNLITYLGYTEGATHTTSEESCYQQLTTKPLTFPLQHPPYLVRHVAADVYTENTYFDYQPSLWKRANRKVRKVLGLTVRGA
jgi:hypothetical protein